MPAATNARILAVDDNPIIRADLRLMLEDAGFEVCDARDGVEAVDLAREQKPDLVLIDMVLPRLDGVEATRRILEDRDVPVVALTGHSRSDFVKRAVDAGAVGHVLKPFSRLELLGTVSGALADRAERDEYRRRVYLTIVESMVRAGHSEKQIARAIENAQKAQR